MTTTKIPVEFLNALSGSEITDGSIGTADIADSAITTAKIAANAITATQLPDNVITATHIPNGLITGTHMAGTTITATQIANNAVGTDQLAGIARGKIIYGDSNGDPQLLALGSNGQVLKSDGSDIAWSSDVGETNRLPLAGGTLTGALTIPSDIIHSGDTDTILQFNAADSWRVITGDEERLKVNNGEVVVNDNSVDMDFRVESNGNANMLFVNGGNNKVGIRTDSPISPLHVKEQHAGLSHGYVYADKGISIEADEPMIQLMATDGGTHGGSLLWRYGANVFAAVANPTTDNLDFIYGVTSADDFDVHAGTNMSGHRRTLSIGADGNVGIGDTSPWTKLHVEDTSWSSGAPYGAVASFTGNNVNDNNWGHLIVTDSSTANGNGGSIRFGTGTADSSNLNPFAGIQGVAEGTSYGGLALYTRPSGGTATERMRIDSTGEVGIGTTSPDYVLDVEAAGAAAARFLGENGSHGVILGGNDGGFGYIGHASSGAYDFQINSGGNVGIGVTPKTTEAGWTNLSVGGQGALINSTSANAGGRTQLSNNVYVDESGNYSYISTDEASLYKQINGIHSWHNAASGSADAHITMSERMRITADGNVGISAVTSPDGRLHVKDIGGTSTALVLEHATNDVGKGAFLRFKAANQAGTSVDYGQIKSETVNRGTGGHTGTLRFYTATGGSLTEKMSITADGYLWLRNTTANYDGGQFQMTSASTCQTMYVSNTGFADPQVVMGVERGASSAYKFFNMYSGRRPDNGGGDVEFQIRGDGNAYADGSWAGGGADYAEYFEWSDGNASSQDRIGLSVVLDGNKIREATGSDAAGTIIGVISGNPAVVGDTAYTKWTDKYQKDDYGRYVLDSDGHRQENSDYNDSLTYVERENRKEWDTVGLMGKLRMKKGQQTGTNWIKMRDVSGSVEEWLVR